MKKLITLALILLGSHIQAQISTTINKTNVSCYGGTNGKVSIKATGAADPYTYHWENGATVQDRTGLSAGTYTCTVTDIFTTTVSASVTITQPTQLSVIPFYIDSTKRVALASGGTTPYSYKWNTSPIQTTDTVYNLVYGNNYKMIVTDKRGCTILSTFHHVYGE
jgi:hypothetical protein